MKKIGILSDTHSYWDDKYLHYFEPCDEIWHAGDIGSVEVAEKLAAFRPFRAVCGNCDGGDLRLMYRELNRFKCEDVDVLIKHIGGYPGNYDPSIRSQLYAMPPQLFVAGHSHILKVKYDKTLNLLHINPGAAGIQGWHKDRTLVRLTIDGKEFKDLEVITLGDTYAGNLANLKDIENKPNYEFVKMDICDFDAFYKLMQDKKVDGIIHLAAESHVDRSIKDPFTFAKTNVMGTLSLLQAAKLYWESLPEKYEGKRFYHISTDEVYGALELTHPEGIKPPFTTTASSSEHHLAYGDKFFLDYGPYQFPEKLIPLFINNIRHRKPLPVYGKGENVRDWLYVEDHARAIDVIFHEGKIADTYNIGGFNEWKNIDIIKVVIKTVDRLLGRKEGEDMDLITFVTDRAGHDLRYAIDSSKLQRELGWEPSLQFEEGIEKTVRWYLDNQEWLDNVTSGDYQKYYDNMYANR